MKLNERETATILAALRAFQARPCDTAHFDGVKALNSDEIDALCERINCNGDGDSGGTKNAYLIVQEGGSSGEIYLHVRDTRRRAQAHRRECARAAYRTSTPVEAPARLVETPGFVDTVQEVLRAGIRCEYAK